jgi:hypothetical protein
MTIEYIKKAMVDCPLTEEQEEKLLFALEAYELYNVDELRHVAVNYAINCMHGYEGNFEDWFSIASPSWRDIANREKKENKNE